MKKKRQASIEEMRQRSRSALEKKGFLVRCKTVDCDHGSDTTSLNQNGFCSYCVKMHSREDAKDLETLISMESEVYKNKGSYS